jgi:hypothetical protein
VRGFVAAPSSLVELYGRHSNCGIVRHPADVGGVLTAFLSRSLEVRHDPRHLVKGIDQSLGDLLQLGGHSGSEAS